MEGNLQPAASQNIRRRAFARLLPPRRWFLPGLVVILLVLVGIYWISRSSGGQSITYNYTYSQLVAYKLKGQAKGSGVSLQMPKEFQSPASSSVGVGQFNFTQSLTQSGHTATVANIGAASVHSLSIIKSYRVGIENAPSSIKAAMQNYVSQRLSDYDLSLSQPAALTSNIKDAWAADFSAQAKPAKDPNLFPPLTGTAIFAMGKNTFYYAYATAASNNWQGSLATWQQVINSFKFDQ